MYSRKTNKMQRYTMVLITPPIIRSSKLYTQHRIFFELFLLLTAIVSELEFFQLTPPIIRSSKLYTQNRVFVELFLLLTAIASEFQLTMLCIQF